MDLSNRKKTEQLGMPIGTASGRLRKSLILKLLKEANQNICFQCGGEIVSESELSIEHKIPYLDSEDPVKLFFDLENVAFSHLICNTRASRKVIGKHPSINSYKNGCRCDECREVEKFRRRGQRKRGVKT